jgi:anti-sigma factor RsiW
MPEIHSIDRQELMAYLDGELHVHRAVEVAAHL